MTASVAWLSITAKRGVHVVLPSKVVKRGWEDIFAELLVKASAVTVSSVKIAKNENSQEVSIDVPLSICDQFGCKYVCYILCTGETVNEASPTSVSRPNANNSRIVLPPRGVIGEKGIMLSTISFLMF